MSECKSPKMSSDEEDVHQCGRCKQTFYDIDEYFLHKKAKTCQKTKVKSTLHTPSKISLKDEKDPFPTAESVETLATSEGDIQILDLRKETGNPHPALIYPKKSQLFRTSIVQNELPKAPGSDPEFHGTAKNCEETSQAKSLEGESSDLLQIRKRRRSAPKKAWAEDYAAEHEHDEDEMDDDMTPPASRIKLHDEHGDLEIDESFPVLKSGGNRRRGSPKGRNRGGCVPKMFDDDHDDDNKDILPGQEMHQEQGKDADFGFCSGLDILAEVTASNESLKTDLGKYNQPESIVKKEDTNLRESPRMHLRKRGARNKSLELHKCHMCSYQSMVKDDYDTHLRKKHNLSPYVCKLCKKSFGNQYALTEHESGQVCVKSNDFLTKEDIDRGALGSGSRLRNKKYRSDDESSSLRRYVKHIVAYRCLSCGSDCRGYEELRKHVQTKHTDISPAICPYCSLFFGTKNHFMRHLNSSVHDYVSEEELTKVKSEWENVTIKWTPTHPVKQPEPMQYECTACCLEFQHKSEIETHVRQTHLEKDPSAIKTQKKCTICQDSFYTKSELNKHLTDIHGIATNTKKQNKKSGKDSHNKEDITKKTQVEYNCKVCGKKFNQMSHLYRHNNSIHVPVQQMPDSILNNMAMNDINDLLEPIESVIEIAPVESPRYECFVCCLTFDYQKSYREHMELHKVWIPDAEKGCNPPDLISSYFSHACGSSVTKIVAATHPTESTKQKSDESNHSPSVDNDSTNQTDEKSTEKNVGVCLEEEQGNNQPAELSTLMLKMIQEMEQNTSHSLAYDNSSSVVVSSTENIAKKEIDKETYSKEKDPKSQEDTGKENDTADDKSKEEKKAQICVYCFKTTDSLEEMYEHKLKDHNLCLTWRCNRYYECQTTFSTVEDYKEHHLSVHDQRSWICVMCNDHYQSHDCLLVHKSCSHKPLHQFLFSGKDKNKIKTELHNFDGKNPYMRVCRKCGHISKSKEDWKEHTDNVCPLESHLCDQCGQTFTNKPALARHRITHDPSRNIQCQLCKREFNKREHLRRHMVSKHSDLTPYACTFEGCTKKFKRRDKLQEHQRVHSDHKPYVCNICGRRYRYNEGLKYHIKTHDRTSKQYLCIYCRVPFPRPGMLKTHMKEVHQVDMKRDHIYRCEKCDSTFSRPERYKRHMEREHQCTAEWAIKCKLCKKGFPGQKSLETHMKQRHFAYRSSSLKISEIIGFEMLASDNIYNTDDQDVEQTDNTVAADDVSVHLEAPMMTQENEENQVAPQQDHPSGFALQQTDGGLFLLTPQGAKIALKHIEGQLPSLSGSAQLQLEDISSGHQLQVDPATGHASVVDAPQQETQVYMKIDDTMGGGGDQPQGQQEEVHHAQSQPDPGLTSLPEEESAMFAATAKHEYASQSMIDMSSEMHKKNTDVLQTTQEMKDQNLSMEIQYEIQKHLNRELMPEHDGQQQHQQQEQIQQLHMQQTSYDGQQPVQQTIAFQQHPQTQQNLIHIPPNLMMKTDFSDQQTNMVQNENIGTNVNVSSIHSQNNPNLAQILSSPVNVKNHAVQITPPQQQMNQILSNSLYQSQNTASANTQQTLILNPAMNQNLKLPIPASSSHTVVQQGNLMIPVQINSLPSMQQQQQQLPQQQHQRIKPSTGKNIPIKPMPETSMQTSNLPQLIQVSMPSTLNNSSIFIPSLNMAKIQAGIHGAIAAPLNFQGNVISNDQGVVQLPSTPDTKQPSEVTLNTKITIPVSEIANLLPQSMTTRIAPAPASTIMMNCNPSGQTAGIQGVGQMNTTTLQTYSLQSSQPVGGTMSLIQGVGGSQGAELMAPGKVTTSGHS